MNQFYSLKKQAKRILVLVISAFFFPVMADTELTSESRQLLQHMRENIKDTLVSISQIETAAGKDMDKFYYQLSLPQYETVQLGMVMDIPPSEDGFKVLSTSPHGLAEKMGVLPGDVITKLNDYEITRDSYQAAFTQLKQFKNNQDLQIVVKRGEREERLEGSVVSLKVPSIILVSGIQHGLADVDKNSNCGRVSVFDLPRGGDDLHSASFHKVNEKNVMSRMETQYKLPPGKHVIYLKEQIRGENLKRSRNGKAKAIEIQVEAGKQYNLAARFIPQNRMKIFKGEYWQPALWQVTSTKCLL